MEENDKLPELLQPEVSWVVQWKSKAGGLTPPIHRRDQEAALDLAKRQRKAGFEVKLFRVEQTEVDF